ncbi:hypothetical protein [Corallococcus silvisoli]|uniref:hypothetical protein n=1 Tax=Corallococcus silvisoli TaxID=2697031 RepID=UPI00137788CB|nr:hypothetical protein [Corallococcus silvisoli]NBD11838.1 hypothetical protein [Corallococcus silvisoli]
MNTRREQPLMERHEGGVGPYRFGRRLRVGEGLGRVYEARNEETGNPAYVVTPTGARFDLAPDVALQYLVTTSVRPSFIACELLSVETGASPGTVEDELADTSEDVMDIFQSALRAPQRMAHLLTGRVPVAPRQPPKAVPEPIAAPSVLPAALPVARPRPWLRMVAAGAVAATAVVLAVHSGAPPEPPPSEPTVVYVPATVDDGVMTNTLSGGSSSRPLTVERRLSVPDRPLDGQKVPPCSKPEREVNGGCWIQLKDDAPCPPKTAEYKGGCYMAVPAPPGQSLWELPPRGMAPASPSIHRQP